MAHGRIADGGGLAVHRDATPDPPLAGGGVRLEILLEDPPQRRERGLHGRRVRHRHVRGDPGLEPVDLGEDPTPAHRPAGRDLPFDIERRFETRCAEKGRSAACSTCPRDTPSVRAAHVTTVPIARPIRFQVSSTRPAPRSGDESKAARSRCQRKPPRCCAKASVRSTRRLSRSWAMSARERDQHTLREGRLLDAQAPNTNCHPRSMRAVITASTSPTSS
jgi:hypothetical protein